jgi:hypothetical protein
MANKQINDLQLRSDFDATCNIPVDDASQTWRATGAQLLTFLQGDASLITGKSADTAPQSVDSILTYDLSATAMKKVTKADFLKKKVTAYTTTATASVEDNLITVTAAASWSLALPTAVGIAGKEYEILRTDNAPGFIVTLDPSGAETVGGFTTVTLVTKGESWRIVSDGTNWQVLDHRAQTDWSTTDFAITPSAAFGTYTGASIWCRRAGSDVIIRGYWLAGNLSAGTNASIGLPATLPIDTAKFSAATNGQGVGSGTVLSVAAANGMGSNNYIGKWFFDGSTANTVFFTPIVGSSTFEKKVGTALGANGIGMSIEEIRIPISSWYA